MPDFSRTAQNYKNVLPSFSSGQFQDKEFLDLVGEQKIALVFGNELMGISKEWNDLADMYVHVDMWGFSESLNVSVCAGIILHSLRQALEKQRASILLNELEEKLVLEHWLAKDYVPALQYITHKKPELLPWLEFIRGGRFFT